MDHLQRHRTREGANIRVQAELFFFQLFFLSGPIIMKRKKETMTQREPQISQKGEERQSKKH